MVGIIQSLTGARIVGSPAGDVLVGTDQGEQIGAREGNDQVFARGGNDAVFAGAGNDTVFAGSGADRIFAGIGNDLIFGGLDNDILYGGEGNDTLYVGEGSDTVYAGPGNDLIGAGAGKDVLYGGAGNDTIFSAAGNDSAFGGTGDDVLYGGDGNDTIRPGAGNDTVFGGAGTDIAVLSGLSTAYSWSGDGTVTTIGPDGTDVLNGVEYLKFDDKSVYIGPTGGGGGGTGNRPPVGVADSITVNEGGSATTVDGGATSVLANDTDPENNALTAILVSGPANGTLTLNPNGTFSYAHNGSETTTDSFTYKVNDGTTDGNTVTVSIAVNPVNEAPVGVTDSITVNEGGSATTVDGGATSVLANDSDPENDPLTAILVSGPANGTLTLNPNGTFSYAHNGSETTSDSFSYKVNDGIIDGNTVTVAINVNPVNDAPVAVADSITVNEGGSATTVDGGATTILANDSDPNNDPLTAILVSGPANGSLTLNDNGTFSYVHNGSETTSDSFSYKVNDGTNDGNTVTVAINVTPVNDAPVAVADSITVNEGGSATTVDGGATSVLANDTDPENNTLTAILVSGPANGTLILNSNGTFSYAHNGSETTTDSFSYKVNDGIIDGNTVTVAINVTPVNDAPVGSPTATLGNGTENTFYIVDAADLLAGFSDPDGGTLAVTGLASSQGSVSDNGDGSFTVNLPTDYNGPITLSYSVSDSQGGATPATQNFTVDPTLDITRITSGGNNNSANPVISADGSTVVFNSYASNLVPGQTDANGNMLDIFVYDVESGDIANITQAGNRYSYNPVLSADGSTIAFYSYASNLVPGQTDANGNTPDIFIYDVATGAITNITQAGNNGSTNPVLSADGSTIAFLSYASNLVPGQTDANGNIADVFVYDVTTGAITNITQAGNSDSYNPVISADGSTIAFFSYASNLVPGQTDANGANADIFVYDVASGDIANITQAGNNGSATPLISADGSTIAFVSNASNLVPGQTDANGFTQDILLYDVATGTITNITQAGNSASYNPVISADGSTIAFQSNASNLVPGQTDANGNTPDIFVCDVATGVITNITQAGNSDSYNPVISADGSTIAFFSYASNLVPGQTDANSNTPDIFLYDVASGDITNITEAGDGYSFYPSLSADGSMGSFFSFASNLTPDQTAAPFGDLYLFDV